MFIPKDLLFIQLKKKWEEKRRKSIICNNNKIFFGRLDTYRFFSFLLNAKKKEQKSLCGEKSILKVYLGIEVINDFLRYFLCRGMGQQFVEYWKNKEIIIRDTLHVLKDFLQFLCVLLWHDGIVGRDVIIVRSSVRSFLSN